MKVGYRQVAVGKNRKVMKVRVTEDEEYNLLYVGFKDETEDGRWP